MMNTDSFEKDAVSARPSSRITWASRESIRIHHRPSVHAFALLPHLIAPGSGVDIAVLARGEAGGEEQRHECGERPGDGEPGHSGEEHRDLAQRPPEGR